MEYIENLYGKIFLIVLSVGFFSIFLFLTIAQICDFLHSKYVKKIVLLLLVTTISTEYKVVSGYRDFCDFMKGEKEISELNDREIKLLSKITKINLDQFLDKK